MMNTQQSDMKVSFDVNSIDTNKIEMPEQESIPDEVMQQYMDFVAKVQAESKPPQIIHINELDPEAQKVANDKINAVMNQVLNAKTSGLKVEVKDAYNTTAEQPVTETIAVVPDEAIVDNSSETTSAAVEEVKPVVDTAIASQEPIDTVKYCPYCGFDVHAEVGVECTDEDKEIFILSTCTGQPFKKEYVLLGGRIRITLKSPLKTDVDACTVQLNEIIKNNEELDRKQINTLVDEINVILNLDRVDIKHDSGYIPLYLGQASYTGWKTTGASGVRIMTCREIIAYIKSKLSTANLFNIIITCIDKFNRTQDYLLANVFNENFYTATMK